jgi:putative methyltransferase
MRRIYIVALHQIPFLPYLYGLLRAKVELAPDLRDQYCFGAPVFLPGPLEEIVALMEQPDVVGLSCYVWNFRRHMKLASLVRQRFPNCLIVAGGPHIPNRPGTFLEEFPFVDVLVHGEGEQAFAELLRQRLRSEPVWQEVGGISFRDGTKNVQVPRASPPAGRNVEIPSPYLGGYLQSAIDECHARGTRFYALWETNRGCPYSCTFCDWGSATMSKVRQFHDDQVFADIDYFGRQRIPNLFICDANFGILPRDEEIAHRLAAARRKFGYPQQVRVNFAKNSNDRVFEISRIFSEHEMLMGTTLSMQSMDMDVLAAVERSNIGFANFQQLSHRYRAAGIHTYSELILGLPRETRHSFEEGIGALLEGGSHEDIRVFDFMILPNSAVNTPASFAQYGLKTVHRRMYLNGPSDENECAEFVVETNTLSRLDWVHCQLFAQAVQFLHNGCFTRYLAIYVRRAFGLPYAAFYRRLIGFALGRPESVLGSVLLELESLYRNCTCDEAVPYVHMVASRPSMLQRVRTFGRRRGWTADQWAWLCISLEQERFYTELQDFVDELGPVRENRIAELFRFQSDIMLNIGFDPQHGKHCEYEFDFPAYFGEGADLLRRPVRISFRDYAMGVNHQYPLVKGDAHRFAKAAVGESYPFVRIRHFQHQLADADISYPVDTLDKKEESYAIPS